MIKHNFLLQETLVNVNKIDENHYNRAPIINPLTAKLFNLNFHPLEVVSR